MVDTPGEHYSSRLGLIADIEKALDIEIEFGHPSRAKSGWLEKWRKHFLRQLVAEIEARFPDTDILSALGGIFMLKPVAARGAEHEAGGGHLLGFVGVSTRTEGPRGGCLARADKQTKSN